MVKGMSNDGSSSVTKQMDNSDSEFGDVTASNLLISPGSSVIPKLIGQLAFEITNNTTLTLKVKGSDGIVRSAALTLS
jgi:hypothetical protein